MVFFLENNNLNVSQPFLKIQNRVILFIAEITLIPQVQVEILIIRCK